MSSSDSARLVLIALWLVGTLVSASAQLRVVKHPAPRRTRYAIAWLVCTLVGGGLLTMMDNMIGSADWPRRLSNAALAAGVFGAALAAGAWLTQRPEWTRMHGVLRFLTLAVLHATVVFVAGYFFI